MKPKQPLLWFIGIVVLGCLAFFFLGSPVDRPLLASLKEGMNKNEVAKILGAPDAIQTTTGGTLWIYETPCHRFAVEVWFDGLGRYERHWREP